MLTKYDELLCHQTVSTFDHPGESDRNWTERLWCNIHDTSGKLEVDTGFGYHPNRNVIDGFGGVTVDGKTQYYTMFSRELRPQIDEVKIGPLSWEVIEGLRRIRCVLGENEYGVSFDVEFIGRMPAHEEIPQFRRDKGRVVEHICRWAQLGRARGWVKVEGQTYELSEDTFWAQRDHSWGIRGGVGAEEVGVQPIEAFGRGWLLQWCTMQFDEWGLMYQLRENQDEEVLYLSGAVGYPFGDARGELELVKVEHDFQFHPGSRRWKSGKIICTAANGSKKEVTLRPLTVFHLRAGGYLGYKGWNYGMWMGPFWKDGGKWDVSDPKLADELHAIDDVVCEYRCGNEVGYGIIEFMIRGQYPRYGF